MRLKIKIILAFLFIAFSNARAQNDTSTIAVIDSLQDSIKENHANHKIYKINPWVDIPIVAVGAGWSGFAFSKIYNKKPSTPEEIENLDRNDIPAIDRWAAGMSDANADANSNYLFYGTIPVPFTLLLDKKIRRDAAKIGYMYLEAMSITGLFYTGSVYFVDRYRPETYDTTISVDARLSGNYKDAFLAGHPALVATGLFFTAKVFADYNPESGFRYIMYGVAIAGTGATAYLRHIAGKHFPTDLITGITLGTLSGILVPQFHKCRKDKNPSLGFFPYMDGKIRGITMTYRLD